MPVAPGDVVEGKVVKVVKFGVIVEVGEGKQGLVHISEIADAFVRDVGDYFEEGDSAKVKVLGTDDRGRLQLSVKQAETREPIRPVEPQPRRSDQSRGPESFEERLSAFMKHSEKRLVDLKRNRDPKRRKKRRK
ncbi:MAG: S1 RNA-binding domain-containing protein [Armatimonadetes bacterium]|nr:S1 RNA-binding domain-containing protein [Armatimonadota bacterium]